MPERGTRNAPLTTVIEARTRPWDGAGCVFKNANPGTANSRAQLRMTYGQYTEPVTAGEVNDLPGHNGSYKQAALLEYGDRLASYMAGKIWGYIAGHGKAQVYINGYEFDRYRYITEEDVEHIEKLA